MSTHGEFKFRTPEQAAQIGLHLASLCPNPQKIAIGLTELLFNAIEHGNLAIGFEMKKKLLQQSLWMAEIEQRLLQAEYLDKNAKITFSIQSDLIIFDIYDQGDGFQWKNFIEKNLDKICLEKNGRGILLAHNCFDELLYHEPGNHVTSKVHLT